jgi:hypothetical protein
VVAESFNLPAPTAHVSRRSENKKGVKKITGATLLEQHNGIDNRVTTGTVGNRQLPV